MTGIAPAQAPAGPPGGESTAAAGLFAGGGEMAALCRATDWAATPLGPVEGWPQSLRTTVRTLLACRNPMFLWWGPELVQIYNDAYRPSLGEGGRHPRALGARGREFWTDIWDTIGPQIAQVMSGGEATWHEDQYLPIERNGRLEDVWWTYSYSPVFDDDGSIGGTLVVCQETTRRLQAVAQLRDSEVRYRGLFESLHEGFCVVHVLVDHDGRPVDYRFLEANPAFARQTGLVDAVGRTARELVPELEPHWFELYGGVALTGEPARFEAGSEPMGRWYDGYAFRIGRPEERRVAILFKDITAEREAAAERNRLVAALEVERARLAEVFRQAPTFLAVLRGPEHVFELANEAYARLVGRRDLVGRPLVDALPEVRDQGFVELLDEVLATGAPYVGRETPIRLVRTPGMPAEERFVDFVYQPLTEADGARSGVVAHGSDVTEQVVARREVERLLAESEAARAEAERLRQETLGILRGAGDGILGVDPQGRTTFANPAAERLLGWSADEMIGRSQHDLIHHSRADGTAYPATECPLYVARLTGQPRRVEGEVFWRRDGTAFPVEYEMTPVLEHETLVGAVVTFRDISDRMRAAAEREALLAAERAARAEAERARAEAEAANRAKSEFLATMSHELRTPLNAIGGYAELMEMGIRGPVTEEQRQDLWRVQQSQRHLLGLINDVLNYAKLETGTVHFDIGDVPLDAALTAAEALVAPQARSKRLALEIGACPPGLAARADAEKLRQILVNLMGNAIKFTHAGGRVAVSCSMGGGRVRIRVADTGIGIPADRLDEIFDPFVQVRADLARPHEGTGLGLAISRDLAVRMDGDITVRSTPGEGSVFTLVLPAS